MALLNILEFPDPRLRKIAAPVKQFDDQLIDLVDEMFESMYQAPGIGLAATQVNIHKQVIVMDISEDKNQPLVFINPTTQAIDSELGSYDEGCLAVPGFYESVERPKRVKIDAYDQHGKAFSIEDDGLLAVCIQHEIDHLNGKLFVDYLSPLKRGRIRKKLEKIHRQQSV